MVLVHVFCRHQSNPCFGRGIESIFELPLNICSNLSTFAFYIGPHLTASMLLLLVPLNSLSDFQHCMWKFLSKGENVHGKRMEHRVFDLGFDCTFSLLCQGNWKEQCSCFVFSNSNLSMEIGIGKITWERAIVDLEEYSNSNRGLKTIGCASEWVSKVQWVY